MEASAELLAHFGANQRCTIPASPPPISGATQNSQSCSIAHPPWKIATAAYRAGFTEVLATGIEIRWISVSASPMASGA